MNFLDLAKTRYSARAFYERPVEEDKLYRILEAGRVAPTAANKQPQRFLVVSSREGLQRLGGLAGIYDAPLAVVVCQRGGIAWVRPQDGRSMGDTDTAIAATHMILEAWDQGIASCWVGYFDPEAVRQAFGLPENAVPTHILAFGYASGEAKSAERHRTERIPLDEMVWKESTRK